MLARTSAEGASLPAAMLGFAVSVICGVIYTTRIDLQLAAYASRFRSDLAEQSSRMTDWEAATESFLLALEIDSNDSTRLQASIDRLHKAVEPLLKSSAPGEGLPIPSKWFARWANLLSGLCVGGFLYATTQVVLFAFFRR